MRTPRKDERTIILLLGAFCLGFIALFAMACGEPYTDVDDIEHEPAAEVEGIEQDSWCFGFPYRLMGFPENQGAWRGDAAGQTMVAPFWTNACFPTGTDMGYAQEDGEINLVQNVGWAPSTCWTWKGSTGSGIVCNGQSFQCPANACLGIPAWWQLEATPPLNAQIWNWVNPNESSAPGRHGIWPKVPSQCSSAVANPQFTPNGSGGSSLVCKYPMGTYWLRQF